MKDVPTVLTKSKDGTTTYWLNGKIHRVGGPAVIKENGTEYWYLDGRIHRTDGPSFVGPEGSHLWHIHGTLLSLAQEEVAVKINQHPEQAPLYINDPVLKYICMDVLNRQ